MAKLLDSSSSDDSRMACSASFTRPRALVKVSSVTDNPLPKHFCLHKSIYANGECYQTAPRRADGIPLHHCKRERGSFILKLDQEREASTLRPNLVVSRPAILWNYPRIVCPALPSRIVLFADVSFLRLLRQVERNTCFFCVLDHLLIFREMTFLFGLLLRRKPRWSSL